MIAVALAAAAAVTADKPTATPRAEVVKLEDGTRTDLTVDGPVLDWGVVRRGDRRIVMAYVGPPPPAKAPTACGVESAAPSPAKHEARLFAWDMQRAATLSLVGSALPQGLFRVVDVDGDGADEIVVFGEDGIDELVVDLDAATTAVRRLIAGRFAPVESDGSPDRDLRAVSIGAVTTYRRAEEGALRPASEVELPIVVYRRSDGVHVRTASFRPLGRSADGRLRFVTGMERLPDLRRVRTLVLDPDGPADTRTIEAWGRFPSRERALEHEVVLLDGAPVLIVLTTPGDKLSLFGEKLLHIFPLQADRTRNGVAPLFTSETGINLWQGAASHILDLDGDGRDDLVFVYWKGLKDTIAALEVRRRADDGSFEKPKTFDFDVEKGDRGSTFYGRDLDGDGRPDLALHAGGAFQVFPGSPPDRAIDRPVAKVPSRRIPLPDDLSTTFSESMSFGPQGLSVDRVVTDFRFPRFIDLDGDGRVEGIFAGGTAQAGRLAIIRFR